MPETRLQRARRWLAERFRRAGGYAARQRNYPRSRFFYRITLALAPHDSPIWVQYGHALRETGRYEQGLAAYRRALEIAPDNANARRNLAQFGPRNDATDRLGSIMIGTTGLCNASCIHCPTGKAETAHTPRQPMPMALFRKIVDGIADEGLRVPMAMPLFKRLIDEIADLDLTIYGSITFGLFGDGLVDPHVVERARYLRERLPQQPFSVNTNGAAFNPARHAELREFDPTIALHCESLIPETYDDLMRPLRLERVKVKFEQILETFPGRVHLSVPASRRNAAELPEIRRWFTERGAYVSFDPMASRCAQDLTLFNELAFAPFKMECTSRVLEDLAIDSDGLVLACCQDFRREEPIGDVSKESLAEVLYGARRAERARFLDDGRHAEASTCSRCYADRPGAHAGFEAVAA